MTGAPIAKAFSTPGQQAGPALQGRAPGLRLRLTLACQDDDLCGKGTLAERSVG